MWVNDFDFELPSELIAQVPLAQRSASRLLCLDREQGDIEHQPFVALLDYVKPGDLLVFNNTRVIPARLRGYKATGGQVELLVERLLNEQRIVAHIKASRAPKAGCRLLFADGIAAEVIERQGDLFVVDFVDSRPVLSILEAIGSMPLPPYITRAAEEVDSQRYQTVYAQHDGAVAAPTAGLHFDDAMLEQLQQRGVESAYVTLHVGAGTFQPVRASCLEDHVMHYEYMVLDEKVCQQVEETRSRGGRVFAIGTTSVRCLETAAQQGELKPFQGDTNLFIYPGYQFNIVDAILTNFHLPQSTLLMLVSAFADRQTILKAYQEAVAEQYRFFSYGDAMLII